MAFFRGMQSIRQEWQWEWEWVAHASAGTPFLTPRVQVHRSSASRRLNTPKHYKLIPNQIPFSLHHAEARSISDSRKSFGRSVDLGVYASNLNHGSTEIAMGERRWLCARSKMMNR